MKKSYYFKSLLFVTPLFFIQNGLAIDKYTLEFKAWQLEYGSPLRNKIERLIQLIKEREDLNASNTFADPFAKPKDQFEYLNPYYLGTDRSRADDLEIQINSLKSEIETDLRSMIDSLEDIKRAVY